jgi:hypothetical protein
MILLMTLVLLSLLSAYSLDLRAQADFEFWPGAKYDSNIPTFKQVLGREPGERITSHAGIMKYLEALQEAAPGRLRVFEYARSWEGRKLVYAALGSEANLKQLEAIRSGMQKLADPRKTPEAEATKVITSLPALVWLGYGVHGNEISSTDAALLTAYHLLAVRNDRVAEEILSKTLLLIDPTQNPDGRDRFVHSFEIAEGLEPDASPLAAEHNEPWPGGRTNHYYFDMNRDWFALTQPETQGRVKALQQWYPLVFVDLHEMGSESTYYFAPEAVPYNPHLAKDQRISLSIFGKNNAKWFDQFGFDYFTREIYDAFFPGYGASWPSYYGAVAMTYEEASTRGLVYRRADESLMHYRDTVRRHFVASISTAETAATNREKLLQDFYRFRRSAIQEGSSEKVKEYILPRRGNSAAVDKLAALLVQQGVEVKRATVSFKNTAGEFPAGSFVIPLAQPAKRLIRTLLDPDVPMEDSFVKEQERRRKKRLDDEIYDVTGWSLPALFGVEAIASPEMSKAALEPAGAELITAGKMPGENATVAYLVPWGSTAAGRFLTSALREGLRVFSTDKAFAQNGRSFPSGTLILKIKDHRPNLRETLEKLATASGAEVVATNSGWVDEGVNFGSRHVTFLKKPQIALAWDSPTFGNAAGATRFVLEQQFGYPVTVIRTRQLASADMSRFHVIILPDGGFGEGYDSVLGVEGARRLKEWVSAGGTLIGVGGAVSFLADQRYGLLAISAENLAKPAEAAKKPEGSERPVALRGTETAAGSPSAAPSPEPRVPGKLLNSEDDFQKAIQPDAELPDSVAGVLVRAHVDDDHWITAGVPKTVHALVNGRAVYTPIKLDKGVNAAVYEAADKLLAGGYLWEENRKQLAFKPLVVVQPQGRGTVIGFTSDPNFRAYMDGLNLLFLNAVFRGPAHARPGTAAE